MYKQVLFPDKSNHTIEMPEEFFGKKVEVIVIEVGGASTNADRIPPTGKKIKIKELFENFGTAPDFPSIEEIRAKAWATKW